MQPLQSRLHNGRPLNYRGPRIIAPDRQAPRICPRMIPLCSRFDSVLFTPKMFRIASYGDYSRSPKHSSSAFVERPLIADIASCRSDVRVFGHWEAAYSSTVVGIWIGSDTQYYRMQSQSS